MKLLARFGQTVTLAVDAPFGRHFGEDGDEWTVPAGVDVVLLDSHKQRGGALIVNSETDPEPGCSQGKEIYGVLRYADIQRYPHNPGSADSRRPLWSYPETPAGRLYQVVKDLPHVVSVGAGDGELIVYVERKSAVATKAVPVRFEGLPVRVTIVGRTRPGGDL